jgi:hypothetical protein
MEYRGFFEEAISTVNGWFTNEQHADFLVQNGLWLSAVCGLFIGVLLAANYAKKIALSTAKEQQAQRLTIEENAVKGFLQALLVESKIVLEIYQNKIGKQLDELEQGQPLTCNYSQSSDYFCVYNNNTHMLGRLTNDALRMQIVKANTLFKGVLNTLEENNGLYIEYLGLLSVAQSSLKPIDENKAKKQLELLKAQAILVKKEHVLMTVQMQQMLDMLRVSRKEFC